MLAIAASFGLTAALITAGAIALVAALPLMLVRGVDSRDAGAACRHSRAAGARSA